MRTTRHRERSRRRRGRERGRGDGLVVAFLGADGAGKSTCVEETARRLASTAPVVREYHGSGDGPSSPLRYPLTVLKGLVFRGGSPPREIETKEAGSRSLRQRVASSLRSVWALVLSFEKRGKLRRTWRLRARGRVILCDRYPQAQVAGFNDGPRLTHWLNGPFPFRALARWERVPYEWAEAHPPDLAFKLEVSPEVALERKPETPLDEIHRRIRTVDALSFPRNTTVYRIDADRPLADVLLQIQHAIHAELDARAGGGAVAESRGSTTAPPRRGVRAPAARGLTVEFLGIPGAGKSSLTLRLTERLRSCGLSVDRRAYDLVHSRNTTRRILSKLRRVGREALIHPLRTGRSLRTIVATRQRSYADLRTVLFNWLFVTALCRERSNASVVIRDQGIVQALWSIGLFADRTRVLGVVEDLVEPSTVPDVVVVVEANSDSVGRRLDGRSVSWSRVRFPSGGERLLAHCTSLTDDIRLRLHQLQHMLGRPRVVVIRNDDGMDLDKNAERLADTIEASVRGIVRFARPGSKTDAADSDTTPQESTNSA